ncbi:glycoside hydrolase family protein [Methylovulum psychrotolerans]|uniref:Lysozyme n=1 Tax=Methylovulum psychrotolerans TaxID=1704499 RepID=A0A2S5CGH3_9GAMM|nr:hypothetical protein [Methylovulum psychrotolerans]POZ49896.1 hypothetical protein AADEFJLK_04342 [Methylovulum psychrotolerans]
MDDKVVNLVKGHEGFRSIVYNDTVGIATIGYGYNLEANPLQLSAQKIAQLKAHGIGMVEASSYLVQMLDIIEHKLSGKLPWWSKLNLARQAVLLDMAYNLGVDGLLEFKNTLAAVGRSDYVAASKGMLASRWAGQVKDRAKQLANIMIVGRL